ncbi:MAG: Hsp70 family protein, partial [Rhodococcus sp. (in: high G+C Gram-positive bacteria)]
MAAGLGIDVGGSSSTAVLIDGPGRLEDATTIVRATALSVADDRESALAAPGTVDGALLTGYAGRVSDPVALVTDDGRSYTGDELYATTLECLVREARAAGAAEDTAIVVTYPTMWADYTVDRLRNAAARHGLTDLTFVPDALAATAWLQQSADAAGDGIVVVVDLGASALNVSVVRTGAESAVLGRGAGSEDVSGTQIDQILLAHVLDTVDTDSLDPFEPATVEALTALRARCASAKEALSADTETVVPVSLPGIDTDVRLVRSEVEELLRETFEDVDRVVGDAIRAAGVEADDVDRVLLVGGGSSIPMLTETLSSSLRKPVTVGESPATTSAIGAALLAADVASASSELDRAGAVAVASGVAGHDTDADDTDLLPLVSERPAAARTGTPAPASSSPRSAHRKSGSSRKRLAVIGGVAVAVVLLAAGGLSVGTGLVGGSSDESNPAGTSAVETAAVDGSVSATPSATSGSTAPGATTSAAVPGAPGAAV